eukprot:3941051-Rhodomonas_salina.3
MSGTDMPYDAQARCWYNCGAGKKISLSFSRSETTTVPNRACATPCPELRQRRSAICLRASIDLRCLPLGDIQY